MTSILVISRNNRACIQRLMWRFPQSWFDYVCCNKLWRKITAPLPFFFCIWYDDSAKSSDRRLLESPLSAVIRKLALRAWCPLQCLLAKTVFLAHSDQWSLWSGWMVSLFSFSPWMAALYSRLRSKGWRSAVVSICWIGVLLIAPKIILGPMFYTLSSLLLLVFEAVSQVVDAYSLTGLTPPVSGCRSPPA